MFPTDLHSIKIAGLNTSQNIVKTPSITTYGHKLQRLNTWLLFSKTGHINHATLRGESKQTGT